MSTRLKGLLVGPFVLFIFLSCVSAPEKVEQSIEKPPVEEENPAEKPIEEEDPISFYSGPEDAADAIKVMEDMAEEEMDRQARFIYYALLISNNDMEKGREQLDILLNDNPDDPEILSAYIVLMDYLGEDENRDKALDHLIKVDPENNFAINMKGSFALRNEEYKEAEKLFRQNLASGYVDSETLIGLANALMHLKGREEESILIFNRAEEIDSQNPFVYSDRSRVHRFLKDYGAAEDDLSKAIELYPSEWNYLDRARIRIGDLGDNEGAKEDLLMIMDLNEENFFANVYLAGILDEEGDYEQARIHYERVLAQADDYQYAYPSLGKIYFIQEKWAQSAEMYKKALEAGLDEMTYPLMAYLAYYMDGDIRSGNAILNRYIGRLDRSSSIYEMFRYYLAPSSPYFVQMAIDKEKDEMFRERMKFYMAMIDNVKGRIDTAKAIFNEIAERKGAYEFELAALEMNK